MKPSLQAIAHALGGRVIGGRRPHVAAPYPGKKKTDRSLHVFINGDDIGVHVFRDGVDPIATKDHVRRVCGMPQWQPAKRKAKAKSAVPFSVRNHFFGETLAVCRLRRTITVEMFGLLVNDLRLRGESKDLIKYAQEFGFSADDMARYIDATPRHYTADERAKILNVTYAERQHLGLRRTGSVDVDKAGRERARRDRYNARRRAIRASAKAPGVNKNSPVEGRPEGKKERGEIYTRGNSIRSYGNRRARNFPKNSRTVHITRLNGASMRAIARLGVEISMMIAPDAEPIGHTPPYKPIDVSGRKPPSRPVPDEAPAAPAPSWLVWVPGEDSLKP